jgi:hypothetical protein
MKKIVRFTSVLVGSFLVITAVRAHDEMVKIPTSPEFQQIKALTGQWEGMSSPMGPGAKPSSVKTEFRVTSAGSAIEETLMKGSPHEMVDMYTDEGGKLAMTHYCAMGNQPHMVAKASGPHQVTLEMMPTPGIDPNSMHMHAITLEFADANHLTERWTNYTNGKPGETTVFTMTRVAQK